MIGKVLGTGGAMTRPDPVQATRRVQRGLGLLIAVTIVGIVGYLALGLSLVDAIYQTVITVSTVGYRELGAEQDSAAYRLFTIVIILAGVGTAFYTLGVLLESLVEGRLTDHLWRRRMERSISSMHDHVIICGWGRVGKTIARHLVADGRDVVVVDNDVDRLVDIDLPFVEGDATSDEVLARASLSTAGALVAALSNDAANLYVTLSGRSARPDLFIVARARVATAESKLAQAGANRVINPQHIGGERIAAMILQPTVADFLDVVMHDDNLEFRLAEIRVHSDSPLAGQSLRDTHLRDRTGVLVLAMRDVSGRFRTNPSPETTLEPGEVLITIGTREQLVALRELVGDDARI